MGIDGYFPEVEEKPSTGKRLLSPAGTVKLTEPRASGDEF